MQIMYQTEVELAPMISYASDCLSSMPGISKMDTQFAFRNRFTHTLRVLAMCDCLLREIPAERDVVRVAAVLHDVGYAVSATDHATHSGSMALGFLRAQGLPEGFCQNVADLISRHSDKTLPPEKMSNELAILIDADCLDEIGALTVLWDAMAEGALDAQNYRKTYDRIAASYKNISGRNRVMKTELGNRLYRQRLSYLEGFLRQAADELMLDEKEL